MGSTDMLVVYHIEDAGGPPAEDPDKLGDYLITSPVVKLILSSRRTSGSAQTI